MNSKPLHFNLMKKKKILKYKSEKFEKIEDDIIMERPLTIFVNNYELLTLMCLPENLEELIIGFLISESLINNADEIEDISFKMNRTAAQVRLKKEVNFNLFKKRTLTSGCGGGATFSSLKDCAEAEKINNDFRVKAEKIAALMADMHKKADYFSKTGGTHISALADHGKIVFTAEDIGRHNTLDKIIGRAFKNKIDLSNKLVFTSGRISSEMVLKILRSRISFLISRSAPTLSAVEMAEDRNLTLVGFCRGQRMNIYSGEERIF
ncbi:MULTISPECIES: formate dehydrogenase accessory sulfurtransferase FdhD [unclassified Halanaerobium]|uniref:formate dehydrogenase accessory sulfurtransferase FdhD n=1 Tax=unclassified Halanaerobium TaxID=2641197 RepID=UPI000DF1583C|nr:MULTISPECIES: formate dehydrogenase accessory sulfurtransferase FdhD [unclassified Halanaerobium]RCW48688.1 FdhD protein [Halanaerobium sp. MA284_MarDTE_T2]RCW86568.1 FdhD protein [Halanaerobium sp. DL-01]